MENIHQTPTPRAEEGYATIVSLYFCFQNYSINMNIAEIP